MKDVIERESTVHERTVGRSCSQMSKEHNSLLFELRSMFLSSQMILSFVSVAMVSAILERISGMDPSSITMASKSSSSSS